jgi:Protein of unknown function (DUF3040)
MALSMDEQRVLAEIERRLAADDPGLATCLTSFRRPGPATVLRSPRARIVGSLFTVLLVALVSLMVYAMIPFRAHGARTAPTAGTGTQGTAVISATGTGHKAASTPPVAANASAAGTGQRSAARSATPSAGATASPVNAPGVKSQAAGQAAPAATGP